MLQSKWNGISETKMRDQKGRERWYQKEREKQKGKEKKMRKMPKARGQEKVNEEKLI